MRTLIFFCFLGGPALALFGVVPNGILKKYSHDMILSNCLGEEVVEAYSDLLKATTRECSQKFDQNHQTDGNRGQQYIDKLTKKADIMECVLRGMNYTDDQNQPNLRTLMTEVDDLNISPTLRDDFKQVVQSCYDFSTCLSADKAKHPLVQKMGRAMAFIKCIEKKEVMACMRQDFIKHANKQGLDGNDDKIFELIMLFGDGKEEFQLF